MERTLKSRFEATPAAAAAVSQSRANDFLQLTKPRITVLVVITTLVGFYVGTRGALPLVLLAHTLLGTALVAGGASAFNMYFERNLDGLMRRTESRPLPSGRMRSREALWFAALISAAGMLYLALFVNILTSVLSALTFLSYLALYTPLKRRTWLCTLIGAAPGALPTTMGWAAVNGTLSAGAWILFAIVFVWQLPHFYAIGWMYREDYARAGFPMLPVVDETGIRTSRQAGIFILLLIGITILPSVTGLAGKIYLTGALALGLLFLVYGILFVMQRDRASARRLFLTSIGYLPLLFCLMMVDKVSS
jgi:heme o synthase